MISAVIPLRITNGRSEALRRLKRVLAQMPDGVTAVVADDSADRQDRARVAQVLSAHANARYVPNPESAHRPFAIGHLRDVGAEAAPDPFVLYHDVDFTAPPVFYRSLLAFVADPAFAEDPTNTLCVPVYFLTRLGTAAYLTAPQVTWRGLLADGRTADTPWFDRLVKGSSAILAHRRTLNAVGGHDQIFEGHGAEDFELLHRLSELHPRGPKPPNYHIDFGSRSQRQDGFRAYFARYGQPALDAGLALVHLWHPRRVGDRRYYAQRRHNFALLSDALRRGRGGDPFTET